MAALLAVSCPLSTNSQAETREDDREVNFRLYVPNAHKWPDLANLVSVGIFMCTDTRTFAGGLLLMHYSSLFCFVKTGQLQGGEGRGLVGQSRGVQSGTGQGRLQSDVPGEAHTPSTTKNCSAPPSLSMSSVPRPALLLARTNHLNSP